MKKFYTTIFLILLITISFTSYTFAETMEDVKNTLSDSYNNIETKSDSFGNMLEDKTKSVKNEITNTAQDIGESISGAMNYEKNMINNVANTFNPNTDYQAELTSSSNSMLATNSSSLWIWMIFTILGIVIVTLLLVYSNQFKKKKI